MRSTPTNVRPGALLLVRSTRRRSAAWRCGSLIGAPDSHYLMWRTGEAAIYRGLEKRTADLKAEQERRAKAAAAADEEFSAEFLSAARKVFEMIDVDNSGT